MKSFAVALCVLATLEAARCHTSEEEIKDLKDCASENNVKLVDINPFFDEKEVSKDVKCFMKCMMLAYKALKEDGTIAVAASLKEHGHEDLVADAEECSSKLEKTDDLCELAYQHSVCMRSRDTDGKVKSAMMEHLDEI